MIKIIFYLVIFYIIGYNYAQLTKDTVFSNFWVMLISLFIFIFLVEWIVSRFKKKGNNNEEEHDKQDEETWDQMLESAKKDFEKTWNVSYENHDIQIVNRYNHEQLYINGKLVSEKKRNHWYSWLLPYQTLTGKIEIHNQSQVVKVKLGGLLSLNCKVYVNRNLIFKKKLNYNLLSGEVKERD